MSKRVQSRLMNDMSELHPFSAESEAEVCRIVLGDRVHGLTEPEDRSAGGNPRTRAGTDWNFAHGE